MYQISELAESVGLSRATLLYYERLGLLKGKRQANGYRVYTDADRQRLRLPTGPPPEPSTGLRRQ